MLVHIVYIDFCLLFNNSRELPLVLLGNFLLLLRRDACWDFLYFFLLFFVEVNQIVILFGGDGDRVIFGVSRQLIELIGER